MNKKLEDISIKVIKNGIKEAIEVHLMRDSLKMCFDGLINFK